MLCPECGSQEVYRSRRQNKPYYKYLCVAKFRCHTCAHLFLQTTLVHTVKYLLSERYREYVYWSELGTGSLGMAERRTLEGEPMRGPRVAQAQHARHPWPAFDERR